MSDGPLGEALTEAVLGQYRGPAQVAGLPPGWLRDFRELVAREPALHGEYLAAQAAAERELGRAIAERASLSPLQSQVLAGMVGGAERAAVMHWMQTQSGSLAGTVRVAVEQAVAGIGSTR